MGKAIDQLHGAEREVIGTKLGQPGYADTPYTGRMLPGQNDGGGGGGYLDVTAPATPDAQRWDGWGTALKPAHEPIVVARKPLAGTVAANVLEWGTGGLNIDATRIGTTRGVPASHSRTPNRIGMNPSLDGRRESELDPSVGRWPANVVLDETAATQLDQTTGNRPGGNFPARLTGRSMFGLDGHEQQPRSMDDAGGASRFFYTAKASTHDRGPGNTHPTVKPVELMRWLIRLVTPSDGTVLDPFAGSGTTGVAALIENRQCILIEREAEYVEIIRRRLAQPIQPVLG